MNRQARPQRPPYTPRPSHWQRLFLYTVGAVLLSSGGVWLAVHYTIGAGVGELPHPLEAWSLRLHGLAAFASAFGLGVLAAAHIPLAWRLPSTNRWARQRNTGLMLCVFAALLVLTGYLLFYFAPETVRPGLGWAHTFVGVAMSWLLSLHRRGVRSCPHATPGRGVCVDSPVHPSMDSHSQSD